MKELDKSGLEFVKMDAHKRINKIEQKELNKGKKSNQRDDVGEEDDDSEYWKDFMVFN